MLIRVFEIPPFRDDYPLSDGAPYVFILRDRFEVKLKDASLPAVTQRIKKSLYYNEHQPLLILSDSWIFTLNTGYPKPIQ